MDTDGGGLRERGGVSQKRSTIHRVTLHRSVLQSIGGCFAENARQMVGWQFLGGQVVRSKVVRELNIILTFWWWFEIIPDAGQRVAR